LSSQVTTETRQVQPTSRAVAHSSRSRRATHAGRRSTQQCALDGSDRVTAVHQLAALLNDGARPAQRAEQRDTTGLGAGLRSGLESMSGFDLSAVQVKYNSALPPRLGAAAYTQGSTIHVAPGQQRHVPHEGWHVVQQMQGRVQPTMRLGGTAINDNPSLEREADIMGARALQLKPMLRRAVAQAMDREAVVAQLAAVVQLQDGLPALILEKLKAAVAWLWSAIKAGHDRALLAPILTLLNGLVSLLRGYHNEDSTGGSTGAGILLAIQALEAAWTAVDEWNAATGEGKELWDKRVAGLSKVATALALVATAFAIPINPWVGTLIGIGGPAGVAFLEQTYGAFAKWWWPANEQPVRGYGTLGNGV